MFRDKKVLLIGLGDYGQITGISQSFEMLISGFNNMGIPHKKIFLETRGSNGKMGSFSVVHSLKIFWAIVRIWLSLFSVKQVYLTIALSKFGFLRDLLIIWPTKLLRRRITLHVKSGGYFTFYSKQSKILQKIIIRTLAQADCIIVLGELVKNQFDFAPQLKEKISIVPNGLTTGLKITTQEKSLSHNKPFKVLYLSNMIVSKGYLVVLEACRILLQERCIPIECDFCGEFLSIVEDSSADDGKWDKKRFVEFIKVMQLDGNVTFHGSVFGKKKQEFLENANVLVLPTAYPWEGQPVCIIEGLAFATPVITTEFRAIPEEITNNYNGIFVNFNSPTEIADSIEYLWRNPDRYKAMSRNAYKSFCANFTTEAHLKRLIPYIIG